MADLTLEELAAKVEGLSGPDRIVDELILLATGWTLKRAEGLGERASWIDPSGAPTAHRQGDGWFKPTASIDAAMTLVPEGWGFQVSQNPASAFATVVDPEMEDEFDDARCHNAGGRTAAIALCAAALRARSNLSDVKGE